MSTVVFFALVTLIAGANCASNCACNEPTDDSKIKAYCSSDFFGIVKIKTYSVQCSSSEFKCFEAEVVNTLKGDRTSVHRIRTPVELKDCGLQLTAGNEYLVKGAPEHNSLEVLKCNYHVDWSAQSEEKKIEYTTFFKNATCKSPPRTISLFTQLYNWFTNVQYE
ncbi:hypothetical protein HDE_12100 [Halotydeus destructor]|nr:hypothetical protein HDE_12100 [Halotydeus destructor]